MKFGLLGAHLSHSLSPQIHAMFADYSYDLWQISPENLSDFMEKRDYCGMNVTIPYKIDAMKYCAELSTAAQKIGSVNTIMKQPNGSLFGDNTDYFGMKQMLSLAKISLRHKHVLILGSGGASRTAQSLALDEECASVTICSRKKTNNFITYNNLSAAKNAQLIINATPVGMFPNSDASPIDLCHFPQAESVVDLIYNPRNTALRLQAKALNLRCADGLAMLIYQAAAASAQFTNSAIDMQKAADIYNSYSKQISNIVLIGMPGCGKTTVGRALANALSRDFIDIDEQIECRAQMPVHQIFSQKGEPYFRKIEREIIKSIGAMHGKVIATGGGCVVDRRNYAPLASNGTIIQLKRKLELLDISNRPLSINAENLSKMHTDREPLYNSFCDFSVDNNGEIAETVSEIREKLNENSCY